MAFIGESFEAILASIADGAVAEREKLAIPNQVKFSDLLKKMQFLAKAFVLFSNGTENSWRYIYQEAFHISQCAAEPDAFYIQLILSQ